MDVDKITVETQDGEYASFWVNHTTKQVIFDHGGITDFESLDTKLWINSFRDVEGIEVS